MSKERELLKRIIDEYRDPSFDEMSLNLFNEIEAELAKPEPEPVAWIVENHPANDTFVNFTPNFNSHFEKLGCKVTPLYTSPPARKPLSDDEMSKIVDVILDNGSVYDICKAIDASYGINYED